MDRNKKIVRVSIYGIIVNIILVIFKAVVGLIANSIAIVLDAINNLTDAMSSVITIIGTKLANKAPDKKHPFGYGRIEYFSSIIIAFIILFAGGTSLKESIEKIINPAETNYSIISLVIVIIAVIVKFVFGRYVKKSGEKLNSQSLVASGTDAFMDSILSFSTFIAAIIALIWKINLEGYLGALISLIIIKSSIDILKETVNSLMGERVDKEFSDKIKEKISSFKEVEGVYDIVLHNYGPQNIIASAHIQVDDDMNAKQIHRLTRLIQSSIYAEFGIIITIGIYASNTSNKEFADVKASLDEIVEKYEEILQLHGYYVDEENNTVMFDLIIDFKAENPEEIKQKVIKEIRNKYPKYKYFVILDNDYSD